MQQAARAALSIGAEPTAWPCTHLHGSHAAAPRVCLGFLLRTHGEARLLELPVQAGVAVAAALRAVYLRVGGWGLGGGRGEGVGRGGLIHSHKLISEP